MGIEQSISRCYRLQMALVAGLLVTLAAGCGGDKTGEQAAATREPALETFEENVPQYSLDGPHPSISFAETLFDLGEVKHGTKPSHRFIFTNKGDRDLVITEIRSNCGCLTSTGIDAPIPPGGEGYIDITFNTERFSGRTTKNSTVSSNDPGTPRITLSITADIKVSFATNPSSLHLGRFSKQDSITKRVMVISDQPETVRITGIESSSPNVTAELETLEAPESGMEMGTKLAVMISVKPGMAPGRLQETISIHTNIEDVPVYNLLVTGQIRGDVMVKPSLITFKRAGEMTPQDYERSVEISTDKDDPFAITSIELDSEHFTTELRTIKEGKTYQLVVRLSENAPKSFLRGEIKMQLDDPDEPLLVVPVMVTKWRSGDATEGVSGRRNRKGASESMSGNRSPG
ncbi:DUF1573 domain-containing protein [bacterium]|nr:DUF1573 domain-containing protein [candidate division CSSED10-310 bacterium]